MTLPDQTTPPDEPTSRRHDPSPVSDRPRAYDAYRRCLRWEFGFTCSLCLLHEVQLAPFGARGSRQFTIEHRELRKERADLAGDYQNLVYACAKCNDARKTWPLHDGDGRRLLDPCQDAWAEHFRLEDDVLVATTPHGEYTRKVYDLNSETKVSLRDERSEILGAAREVLREAPGLLEELGAGLLDLPAERQQSRVRVMKMLSTQIRQAGETLDRYRAIPRDHDDSCRCDRSDHHTLPSWMQRQLARS